MDRLGVSTLSGLVGRLLEFPQELRKWLIRAIGESRRTSAFAGLVKAMPAVPEHMSAYMLLISEVATVRQLRTLVRRLEATSDPGEATMLIAVLFHNKQGDGDFDVHVLSVAMELAGRWRHKHSILADLVDLMWMVGMECDKRRRVYREACRAILPLLRHTSAEVRSSAAYACGILSIATARPELRRMSRAERSNTQKDIWGLRGNIRYALYLLGPNRG